MTRDEAVSEIQQMLGFRTDKADEIQRELIRQQNLLENGLELPYFLRSEVTDLTTTANNERLTPPTDFLREWDEDSLSIQSTDDGGNTIWTPLEKDGPTYLRNYYQNLSMLTGVPEAYAYDGTSFILFPMPDAVYTLRMIYYKKDTKLIGNVENKWLQYLPYLLIAKAGFILASSLRDQGAQQIFAAMLQEQMALLVNQTVAIDGAGRKYSMGEPD